MKIKPDNKTYTYLKSQFKQKFAQSKTKAKIRIQEAQSYIEPKIKSGIKTTVDYAQENYPKAKKAAKEIYTKAKQKLQPKVDDFVSYINASLNPTKQEILSRKISKLEKKIAFKSAFLTLIESKHPQETVIIEKRRKELQDLKKKLDIALKEYKEFTAKQDTAQETFKQLNNIK